MQHTTGTLTGVGGVRLHKQAWIPDAPTSVVLLIHGLGEHSSRYEHVAAALVQEGHAVHTIDHRGHGKSDGRRAQLTRFDDLVADIHTAVVSAQAAHPGLPLFILGHSMGGLVALAYVIAHPDVAVGLVVSGTAASPPTTISNATITVGRMLARVAPNVGVARLPLEKVSRDEAVVTAYFDDPLISKGKVRARMGAELLDAMAAVDAAAGSITLPTLILHGGSDAISDASASRRLHHRLGSTDKQLIVYDGLWHEIFNEPERERVIEDVCVWLRARRPVPA